MKNNSGLFIWAHRGASAFAPENTIAAFHVAEKMGADGIELDIRLSSEGVPVVIHDPRVDRTSDSTGLVHGKTVAELKRLDMGGWMAPKFRGEPIPTLEDVLIWLDNRMTVNIELKLPRAMPPVLTLLQKYPQARALVSCFKHPVLEIHPELPRGFLTESRFWRRALNRAIRSGATAFHPREDRVTPGMVQEAHRAGLKVFPFTVDDPQQAERFCRWGVDGIFTNRLFPQVDTDRTHDTV